MQSYIYVSRQLFNKRTVVYFVHKIFVAVLPLRHQGFVFVDGVFDPVASGDLSLAGVTIDRLAEAEADIHWAKDLFGALETRGQDPVARPLAALNTAYATDGVLIRATGKAERPIQLTYLHRSETSDATLHHVIKVEEGAEVF